MIRMKEVTVEIVKVKHKGVKAVKEELKRKGFHIFDWSEDGTELEAIETADGVVNRKAYVSFSVYDRAVTDIVIKKITGLYHEA